MSFSLSPSGDNRPDRPWKALWHEMMVRNESLDFGRAVDEYRFASFLSVNGANVSTLAQLLRDQQEKLAGLVSNPSGIPTDAGFLYPRLTSPHDTRVIVISDVSITAE